MAVIIDMIRIYLFFGRRKEIKIAMSAIQEVIRKLLEKLPLFSASIPARYGPLI